MVSYSIRNIIISYSIAIAVVLLILGFTFYNLRSQENELGRIKKSREILQKLEPGLVDVQEFAGALDDLLLFGKDKYAETYKGLLGKLKNDSSSLSQLAFFYTDQKTEYTRLAELIHQLKDYSEAAIRKREGRISNIASNNEQADSGNVLLSEFKSIVEKLEAENRAKLSTSYGLTIHLTRRTLDYVSIISGAMILVLLISFRVSYQDIRHRLNYNRDLEEEVNKKTAAIKESEERYRILVEQASDAIFTNDPAGNFTDVNTRACHMLGYTKEELCSMNVRDLFSAADLAERPIMYKELLRGDRTSIERNILNKNGSTIPVDITAQMLSDGRIIAIIRDITQRKKAEEELRKSQQEYSSLMNTLDGIVWEANAQTFAFSFVSKQAERLLGYPVEQWINEPNFWSEHIYPDDRNWAVEYCTRCTREKRSHEFEYRMIASSGGIVWLRDIVTVIVENDLPVQLRGIMVDISETKHIEAKMKASEKSLRSVLTSTADDFYVIDKNYVVTLINEVARGNLAKAWGKTIDIGTNILELFPEEKKETIRQNYDKVFAGERIEYEIQNPLPGIDSWIFVSYMPVRDENATITSAYILTRDITERKNAEEKLRKSEERYRSLIEQASDFIMITDQHGSFIEVNSSLCKRFGYTKEELLQSNISLLIEPEQLKLEPIRFDWLLEGKSLLRERKMMNKNGTVTEVEANVKMLPDGRILAIAREITERKLAEEALTNNELRFRTLTANAPVGIFQTDEEGKTTYVNETWLGFTGMTFEEALGDGWIDAVYPEDRKRLSEEWYSLAKKGLPSSSEYRLVDKKGNIRWMSGKALPIFNKSGEITGHMGTLSDVTERRKAEETIRESEERYRVLVENATEALVVMDVNKNKFVSVSESAVRLFRMTKEQLLNVGPLDVSPEYQADGRLSAEAAQENLVQAIAGGKISFEWTHCDVEGNIIPCEVWLVRLPSENQVLIRGTIVDITERKKTEELIRASEETRRLIMNSALDAIIAIDIKGDITVWTPQAEKIFGWKESEVAGKNMVQRIVARGYRQLINDGFAHFLETGEGPLLNRVIEILAVHRHGEEFPIEISIVPVGQKEGVFFCAFLRDITDRKKAEQEIIKARELADKLVDSLPGIFYLYDEQGKFIRWNKQLESVSEYSGDEIALMHPIDFFRGAEKDYIIQRIQKVFTEGVSDAEASFTTKSGVAIPYYFKAIRMNYEGKPCLLGTGIDIAERLKFEQQLKESLLEIRQLTEYLQNIREEERTHIAREIHDELGQQLTVMKMDISWLSKRIGTEDELIKQKMKGLKEMLDGTVQTVRKIASELRPSLLDDLGLVAAMEWYLKEFENRSGIQTSFLEAEATEPVLPLSTKTGLYRIFQESLTNVARHARAKKVCISLQQNGESIVLKIEDDGIGFDAKKAVTQKTLGILGMKERTWMMGGSYTINSKQRKGTMVEVSVPIHQQ